MGRSRHVEARDRVLSRVEILDLGHCTPCWISNRAAQPNGYTKIGVLGRTWLTHRFAYEAFVGPIPDGMQLDHLCRQRACVNPEHLEPVTCRENLLRGETVTAREAQQTHCHLGHEFTPENTYVRADRPTSRGCRVCRSASARRSKARLAA